MVAHPSLLKVPEDIQNLAKKSTPFLWNHATEDVMFNKEQQKIATEILKDTDNHREFRASPPSLPLPPRPAPLLPPDRAEADVAAAHADWEGATHGFAIRGDPSDPQARQMADGAFEESVKFLKAKL